MNPCTKRRPRHVDPDEPGPPSWPAGSPFATPKPSPACARSRPPSRCVRTASRRGNRPSIARPGIIPIRAAAASDHAPGRTLNSRGPDSAKDPGLLVFLPLRVCPCTPSSQSLPAYAARDVRGRATGLVQRDTASDGRARAGVQPKWKHRVVFVQWPGRQVFNPATRVRSPHTTPSTRSRTGAHAVRRKPAATIGRLRNPSPESS